MSDFFEKFKEFIDITPATIGKDPIVWAMRKSMRGDPDHPEMVTVIKKHLRNLFPEWEKIFSEKTPLDSIEGLSEAGIEKLKQLGFYYLEEMKKYENEIQNLDIPIKDRNRIFILNQSLQHLFVHKKNDLEDIDCSLRIYNVLKSKIQYIEDLENYTPKQIQEWNNIGIESFKEIKQIMKKHGLNFKDEK